MQSQNAWVAGERTALDIVTVTVPGTQTKLPVLAGDVATVLLWVATRWHNEIEPLVEPGNWGYAYRAVRGAKTGLSNHASGTAIDLNAPAHPLGTEPAQTMSAAQIATAKRIEAESGGVVRWGGSYTGRKDPMHWEINAPAARVAALAAQIRSGGPAAPIQQEDDMTPGQAGQLTAVMENAAEGRKAIGVVIELLREMTGVLAAINENSAEGRKAVGVAIARVDALAPGTAAGALAELPDADIERIKTAVADEVDRRARDSNPATGPVS
jgi:hypothetical protein